MSETKIVRLKLSQVAHPPADLLMREPTPDSVRGILTSMETRAGQGQRPWISLPRVYPAADLGLDGEYVISVGNSRVQAAKAFEAKGGVEEEWPFELVEGQNLKSYMSEVYVENTDREDANPVDEALYLNRMFVKGGFREQKDFAKYLDLHPSIVSRQLSLTEAPESLLGLLRAGAIDLGHAYEILRAKGRVRDRVIQWVLDNLEDAPARGRRSEDETTIKRFKFTVQFLRLHVRNEMRDYDADHEALLDQREVEAQEYAKHYGVPYTRGLPHYPEWVEVDVALDELNVNPTGSKDKGNAYLPGVGIQVDEKTAKIVVSQQDAKKLADDIQYLLSKNSGEGNGEFDREPTEGDYNEPGASVTAGQDDDANQSPAPDAEAAYKLTNAEALRMSVYSLLSLIELQGQERIEQVSRYLRGQVDGTIVQAIAYGNFDKFKLSKVRVDELPPMALALATVAADIGDKYDKRWLRGIIGEITNSSKQAGGEPEEPLEDAAD